MFNVRIIVVPTDSTALIQLEWNSVTGEIYTTYKSSGHKTYAAGDVDFNDFSRLCHLAQQLGSWGSALHQWKTAREASSIIKAENKFNEAIAEMTLAQKEHWLRLLREDVKQSDLQKRATRET